MVGVFIDDGFSQEANLKFLDGEVTISFRPAMGDEVQRLMAGKLDPHEFVTSKLISWSGMGLDSRPPTLENLKKIRSRLWNLIFDTVCGYVNVEAEIKKS
jgi:hypothetical protein